MRHCDWGVTFEIYEPPDWGEEACDADARGFVVQDTELRYAVCGLFDLDYGYVEYVEASDSDVTAASWISAYGTECNASGTRETRTLHFPRRVTGASRARLLRYLQAKC